MSKTRKKSSGTAANTSRRAFMKKAVLGAGATAALGATGVGVTAYAVTQSVEFAAQPELPDEVAPGVGPGPLQVRFDEALGPIARQRIQDMLDSSPFENVSYADAPAK